MQNLTKAQCDAASLGVMSTMRDSRDGTYYRVRKMADGKCWMVDNLALDLTANYAGKPNWGTAPAKISSPTANSSTVPQLMLNNNIVDQGQIPNNGSPKASYLYNWCATMGDTSSNCITTGYYTEGQPSAPQTGICPAPFRLPQGGPAAISSNPSTTTNEFAALDIAMGGTGAGRDPANTYPGFIGTADNITGTNWHGVFSGSYTGVINFSGITGAWWSSTNAATPVGYYLYVSGSGSGASVYPDRTGANKSSGLSVRCLL